MATRTLAALAVAGWITAGVMAGWRVSDVRHAAAGRAAAARGGIAAPLPASHAAATDTRVDLVGVATAEHFMGQLAKALGRPVQPLWEEAGLRPEQGISFDLPSADVPTAFRLLNAQVERYSPVDYRVFDAHAEVASPRYFDRLETSAVNYNLSSLVRLVLSSSTLSPPPTAEEVVGAIIGLLTGSVSMEDWADNGGDLARITTIGSGLLITAPARMHTQVRWLLEQYEQTPGWATGLQRLLRPGQPGTAAPTKSAAAPPPPPAKP